LALFCSALPTGFEIVFASNVPNFMMGSDIVLRTTGGQGKAAYGGDRDNSKIFWQKGRARELGAWRLSDDSVGDHSGSFSFYL
jgi:hypothetical protein